MAGWGGVGPLSPSAHRETALRRWASGSSEGGCFGEGTAGGRGYEVRAVG